MHGYRKKIRFLLSLVLLISLLTGCFATEGPIETTPTLSAPTTEATEASEPETLPEETEAPTEPLPPVSSTATITVTGDLLMHIPVINRAKVSGGWDFTPMFRYIGPFVEGSDYAVANLETTLCGADNGYPYSGYPRFNCPDALAVGAKTVGFDMLLTANNHSYDTGYVGLTRTVSTVREAGLATLGTMASPEEPRYTIVTLNDIRVGMICYTYESPDQNADRVSLNGLPLSKEAQGLVNTFDYDHLDNFYQTMQAHLAAMETEMVDAVVLYIHWGEEYTRSPNALQQEMAQKLCDLGVDVIVGGHPHIVQSVELLTATQDESQKTLCIYSTGNALSNQRKGKIASCSTAHTEDGVLFRFTFVKYRDGSVAVQSTDVIPTWVYLSTSPRAYTILPLVGSEMESWPELFGVDSGTFDACKASYDRTMAQIGPGLEIAQTYFASADADKQNQLLSG